MNYTFFKNYSNYRHYLICSLIFICLAACGKQDGIYKHFIENGRMIYTGKVDSLQAFGGKNRIKLTWLLSDPNVTKCMVYWNSGADSTKVSVKGVSEVDTMHTIIDHIAEGSYEFVVYTYDNDGHSSVGAYVIGKVYGDRYVASLSNRVVQKFTLINDSTLILDWSIPDTINITTEVKYTSVSGEVKTVYLSPDSSTMTLSDWKLPTQIYCRSSYKPQRNAIDTFKVPYYDSLHVSNLPVNKSLWKEALLPNDAVVTAYGTALSWLWDGESGGYPHIYHTNGAYIPHTFTFDLGAKYNHLTRVEEWGRTDCACHNPDDFEVWGIADTTGAEVTLQPTDPGWKAASIAKGWTLLTEVKRNDDGIGGVQASLIPDPPTVKFIRIRVLHTIDDSKSSHMSEISFWYNP